MEADLPENKHLLDEYGIASLPAFVLISDGKVWGTLVGAKSEEDFRKWLQKHIEIQEQLNV